MNTARAAFAAFQAAADHLAADAVWADMNTTEPSLKRRPSTLASTQGVAFADFAIMGHLIVSSTYRHAARRADEMAAAVKMLTDLGIEPDIAHAAEVALRRLSAESG
ncbi:MAG: DUF1932 domain-containing protein [Mycobacterium sp.]